MSTITAEAPASTVNGIDVNAVQALAEAVGNDRAAGQTGWRVSTAWQGQTWSRSTIGAFEMGGETINRSFTIDIDEPNELCGQNRFANPQDHLLAALNACMTVGFVAQCALRGIVLESLVIETEGTIDLAGFLGLDPAITPGYESLTTTFKVSGDGSPEQFEEVIAAVQATSPNFHNLARAVAVKPRLEMC